MISNSPKTERRQNIEQTCLRLLARREHSHRELLGKLALRGYLKNEAEPVIAEMTEHGWQNDLRFAECYARQRIAKGYGPIRIRYELQERGIEDFNLDGMATEEAGGWLKLLIAVYQKKYGSQQTITPAEWQKRSRYLFQRGFGAIMIKSLFAELKIKINQNQA